MQQLLVIHDGIAGHDNISRGVVELLATRYSVDQQWLQLRAKNKFVARLLELALNKQWQGTCKFLLNLYYGKKISEELEQNPATIVLGSGGAARFALAYAKKYCGKKVIYTGSPRRLDSTNFNLLLSGCQQPGRADICLVATPMPTRINAQKLALLRYDVRQQLGLLPKQKCALVLIGGVAEGFDWQQTDAAALGSWLGGFCEKNRLKLLLLDSRRTPAGFMQTLRGKLAAELEVDCSGITSNSFEKLMSVASVIVCSADSATMLQECACSGLPTMIFQPAKCRIPDSYRAVLDQLLSLEQLSLVDIHSASQQYQFSDSQKGETPAWQAEFFQRVQAFK